MTPNNIVNMASIAGLDLIAITDHNSCANCRSVIKAAENNRLNLTVIPGMELTTAEEIHIVCLFPEPDAAEAFSQYVESRLTKFEFSHDFFGYQRLMDENDAETGQYPWLLSSATEIRIDEVAGLARSFGGAAMPAHIDRPSDSVLSNLGFFDQSWDFSSIELTRKLFPQNKSQYLENNSYLMYNLFLDSDAHDLAQIGSAEDEFFFCDLRDCDIKSVISQRLKI